MGLLRAWYGGLEWLCGFCFLLFLEGMKERMNEWVGVLNGGFVGMVCYAFSEVMDT